jgi:hypothetical protein
MQLNKDGLFGYIDVATTDRHIFALYAGRPWREMQSTEYAAEWVHVYDWNGRLLEFLHLSSPVVGLAVDGDEERLFAYRLDPAPALLSFPLRTP